MTSRIWLRDFTNHKQDFDDANNFLNQVHLSFRLTNHQTYSIFRTLETRKSSAGPESSG